MLERAHPEVVAATTGALDGKTFTYIGRGRVPESIPGTVEPSDRPLSGRTFILQTTLP